MLSRRHKYWLTLQKETLVLVQQKLVDNSNRDSGSMIVCSVSMINADTQKLGFHLSPFCKILTHIPFPFIDDEGQVCMSLKKSMSTNFAHGVWTLDTLTKSPSVCLFLFPHSLLESTWVRKDHPTNRLHNMKYPLNPSGAVHFIGLAFLNVLRLHASLSLGMTMSSECHDHPY